MSNASCVPVRFLYCSALGEGNFLDIAGIIFMLHIVSVLVIPDENLLL